MIIVKDLKMVNVLIWKPSGSKKLDMEKMLRILSLRS